MNRVSLKSKIVKSTMRAKKARIRIPMAKEQRYHYFGSLLVFSTSASVGIQLM